MLYCRHYIYICVGNPNIHFLIFPILYKTIFLTKEAYPFYPIGRYLLHDEISHLDGSHIDETF